MFDEFVVGGLDRWAEGVDDLFEAVEELPF